jgi:drug/metabolite transporter (DMT)-like permease
MIKWGYALLAAAGAVVLASRYQYRGHGWADTLCHASQGLCDSSQWLAIAAAFLALACVARATITNT